MHLQKYLPTMILAAAILAACDGKSKPSAESPKGESPPAAAGAPVATPTSGEKAKIPAAQPVAANESWIAGDALNDWKLLETAGAGKAEVKGGELTLTAGEGVTAVRYEGKKELPVVDYELSWEAKKLSGVDFFGAATFPVRDAKTCATFINGGWGGGVTGISCLDGASANDNKTCTPIFYDENRWYKFRVQVGAEVIQAWVDDKRVVNCNIKGVEVALRAGDIEGCAPFGFATWMTKGVIRSVIVRKLPAGSVKPDQDSVLSDWPAMSADPILQVEDLSIFRGGVPLLREVTWSILPGERWVIIGPNGSGKTSLLSALAGFLHATSGAIAVLGHVHGESNYQELRRVIGIVSSSVRQMVDDGETALEVIASGKFGQINYWGSLSKNDVAEARRMAGQVRCAPLERRPWAVLSQGERQRVLIGRALLARPKLLILDEPCAGLDPAAREHFLDFIDRLARSRRGPAILLVTHHVEEIMPAFTHVLALRAGKIFAAGRKEEVLRSEVLTGVFGAEMELSRHEKRWWLRVHPTSRTAL